MPSLLVIVVIFFIIINTIITINNISYFKNEILDQNINKDQKIITFSIKVKNHLPKRTPAKLLTKHHIKLFKPQVIMINIINNLNIFNQHFNLLALNLNQIISAYFTLVLVYKCYSWATIVLELLINSGLNSEDAKNIFFVFNDSNLNNQQLLEKLKQTPSTNKNRL